LLVLALLTLLQLFKLFRAAAKIRHRGGSLSMLANIFVEREWLCTPDNNLCVQLRSNAAKKLRICKLLFLISNNFEGRERLLGGI